MTTETDDQFIEFLRRKSSPADIEAHAKARGDFEAEGQTELTLRQEKRAAELKLRRNILRRGEILHRARRSVWNEDVNPRRVEPVVPVGGLYELGNAYVSVNAYGSTCLNSENMFIADIDGKLDGGTLIGEYPWLSPMECIFGAIKLLDENVGSNFHSQCYRVYATYAGYRIICTSEPIKANLSSLALLRFVYSDPRYSAMCDRARTFRARLTPKPYRVLGVEDQPLSISEMQRVYDVIDDWDVCEPIGWFHNGKGWYTGAGAEYVHPDLIEQIRLHDELCLQVAPNAKRA